MHGFKPSSDNFYDDTTFENHFAGWVHQKRLAIQQGRISAADNSAPTVGLVHEVESAEPILTERISSVSVPITPPPVVTVRLPPFYLPLPSQAANTLASIVTAIIIPPTITTAAVEPKSPPLGSNVSPSRFGLVTQEVLNLLVYMPAKISKGDPTMSTPAMSTPTPTVSTPTIFVRPLALSTDLPAILSLDRSFPGPNPVITHPRGSRRQPSPHQDLPAHRLRAHGPRPRLGIRAGGGGLWLRGGVCRLHRRPRVLEPPYRDSPPLRPPDCEAPRRCQGPR
ncbi:hypothetical protein BC936DRAFT_147450 [Jimgerdemannia flammicorona]|uniref:Uncharacterized protein n=1 Tax=Jimgerdemannia flammicorona TaxID=994334 RepID=A0A433D5B1_9FUNG|nr:hypothetical protein BC936DRAFT_147450 [Jimgerdemannia flammicorona]